MPRSNGVHQPWIALKELMMDVRTATSTKQGHLPRWILRGYLREELPERPAAWTRERAEALASGRLRDWTRWEAAAHVADCSRCKGRLKKLQASEARVTWSPLRSMRQVLRQPRWGRVGWAVAGVQTAVLAGLIVWSAFFSVPQVPVGKPTFDPWLNHASEFPSSVGVEAVWVEFVADAPWQEVTTWLQSRGLEVRGPDREGRYLILGKTVTEAGIEGSPWIRRVESVDEEGDAG